MKCPLPCRNIKLSYSSSLWIICTRIGLSIPALLVAALAATKLASVADHSSIDNRQRKALCFSKFLNNLQRAAFRQSLFLDYYWKTNLIAF